MIRPVTCVGFLLACGAGLYLYQAKHRVNVIDQQIERTVHATDSVREQIRLLHAEWTLLNQPDRLQTLADQFSGLKTTNPAQFTSMADLDSRLPPIPPEPLPETTAPVADTPAPVSDAPVVATKDPVRPAKPAETTVAIATKPPERPRSPETRPVDPKPVPRIVEAATRVPAPTPRPEVIRATAPSRPVWMQPRPIAQAPGSYPPPMAAGGSMLGMARGPVAPAPAPPPEPMAGWANGN